MLDRKQSELGAGWGSYAVILLVSSLGSLTIAKFNGLNVHCFVVAHFSALYVYRSVPQIRPPFCISLSTKRRGAYTRDATISHAIMPSLPIKHDSLGGGEAKHKVSPNARRSEAERCSRR